MRLLLSFLLLAAAGTAGAASSLKIAKNGTATTYAAPTATFSTSGDAQHLTVLVESGANWFHIDLAAPRGQSLTRGIYSRAERASFRTGRAPGMDFSGNGSGCGEVWGSFTIRQIGFGDDGKVNLLDATLSHRCDAADAPLTTVTLLLDAEPWTYTYASTPGDFLGQGLKHTFYGHTSDFALTGNRTGLEYAVSGDREDWAIRLAPATGQTLAAGIYETARFAGPGVVGLDIGGNGRGCNTSHGTIIIHNLRTDDDGDVTGLWATYTQYCGSATAPLKGTIRWFR